MLNLYWGQRILVLAGTSLALYTQYFPKFFKKRKSQAYLPPGNLGDLVGDTSALELQRSWVRIHIE